MTVYVVLHLDWEANSIYGVFSSYELADNYINDILSNDENKFMEFYIDERVIDQPD